MPIKTIISFASVRIPVRLFSADRAIARSKIAGGNGVGQEFAIDRFVPAATIDLIYVDRPYYAAPERSHHKEYATFRDALARSKRLGIGMLAHERRPHLAALQPVGAVLVLSTLRFSRNIRSVEDLGLPRLGAGWTFHEMDLTVRLIDALAADWRPKRYDIPKAGVRMNTPVKVARGSMRRVLQASLDEARQRPDTT